MDFWRLERWVRNHQSRRLSDGDIVYVEDGALRVLAIGTAGQVLTADPAGTHKLKWAASGGGGGGGVTDHTALTSLRWSAAGHTDTANRIAGFGGSNQATLYQIGLDLQAWDLDLDAVAGLTQSGLAVRVSAGNWVVRTIQGTLPVSVADGSGAAGNPTVSVAVATTTSTGVVQLETSSTDTSSSHVVTADDLRLSDAREPTVAAKKAAISQAMALIQGLYF